MYLPFLFVLQRAALIVRLCAQISQMAFVLLISIGPGRIAGGRVVSVQVNILHRSFCQFSQFLLAPKFRITILKLLLLIIIIMIIIIIIIVIIIIIIIQEPPPTRWPSKFIGSYRCIFRKYGLQCNGKWYDYKPQPVPEDREVRIT